MSIELYNSLSRRKEPLVPRSPGHIGMYVCGVTVYDYCHIGHARVMVVFDVLVRYLRAMGLQVTLVRNFTDIDDKIIRRAGELGLTLPELTERFIQAFHEDMGALGIKPADVEPRATQHLEEMQTLIARLLERGIAYASGGDIYYAVDRFPRYGHLSGKALADLESGARVAVDERKNNPLDFVLWKGAKPGEPQWDSPWGMGRPGWHIECSAMSCKYLGEQFDIHGGGMDLIFPHHENETAQTEGATESHPWVGHWMHVGFVNVLSARGETEKMSKSLGNFHTIRDLLQEYPGEVLRLLILNSHYRTPLDFSFALLQASRAGLDRLYAALRVGMRALVGGNQANLAPPLADLPRENGFAEEIDRFIAALADDLNTPQALSVLYEVAKRINTAAVAGRLSEVESGVALLRTLGQLLGLMESDPERWFQQGTGTEVNETTPAVIEALIAQRNAARQTRNFAEADRIRQELTTMGIALLDSKEGTTWQRIHS